MISVGRERQKSPLTKVFLQPLKKEACMINIYVYSISQLLSNRLVSASGGHWRNYEFIIPVGYYDREAPAVQVAEAPNLPQ